MVKDVRKKLDKWRGRFLSIGGRVVLINLVLNVIPLYSLSFYLASNEMEDSNGGKRGVVQLFEV